MKRIVFALIFGIFCSCQSDNLNFEMVYVEGGDFIMGSNEEDADLDETPLHSIHVDSFYIGRYEVTQAQWRAIMNGKNPSLFKGNDKPVECVSWNDVQIFINRLNKKTGRSYRLPSEVEWEYAAKGGNAKEKILHLDRENIEDVAWFIENSDSTSHKVGQLQPNELGIYDMIGNVHEWCDDVYDSLAYSRNGLVEDVPLDSTIRVYRGGSWMSSRKYSRVSNRNKNSSDLRNFCLGFRLAESCSGGY